MKTIKQSKAAKKQQQKETEKALKDYIKARDGKICQMCGKYMDKGLNLSHIISRGAAPQLTYNEFNVKLLCYYCHRYRWHNDPTGAIEWLESKYPGRYQMLRELQQKTKVVIDLKEIEQHYINKLKEIE